MRNVLGLNQYIESVPQNTSLILFYIKILIIKLKFKENYNITLIKKIFLNLIRNSCKTYYHCPRQAFW